MIIAQSYRTTLHKQSSQKRFCAAACYGEVKTLTVEVKKRREIFTWRVRSNPIQCSVQYKNYYTTIYEWRDLNFFFVNFNFKESLGRFDSFSVSIVFFSSSSTDDYFSIEKPELTETISGRSIKKSANKKREKCECSQLQTRLGRAQMKIKRSERMNFRVELMKKKIVKRRRNLNCENLKLKITSTTTIGRFWRHYEVFVSRYF